MDLKSAKTVNAQACGGSYGYSYTTYTCSPISGCISSTNYGTATCGVLDGVCSACRDCGQNCSFSGSCTGAITNACPGGPPCGSRQSQDIGSCPVSYPSTPTPTTEPGIPTPTPGGCDCSWDCGDSSDPGRECVPNSECDGNGDGVGWACRDSCGCTGNGEDDAPKDRVVGRVYDTFTGSTRFWQPGEDDGSSFDCGASYQTDPNGEDGGGLRIENSGGGDADWNCNPAPFYDRKSSSSGEGPHDFTIQVPSGFGCSDVNWHIGYPLGYSNSNFPTNPAGGSDCVQDGTGNWSCAGTGCTATVYLGSDDWDNHLQWRLEQPLSCTVSLSNPGTLDPYSAYDPYIISASSTDNVNYPVDEIDVWTTAGDNVHFTPDPQTLNSQPFSTTLYTEAPGGNETIYAEARITSVSPVVTCTDSLNVGDVNNPSAWYQIFGGSIWANKGDIYTSIPDSSILGYAAYLLNDLEDLSGNVIASQGVASAFNTAEPDPVSTNNSQAEGVTSADTGKYNFDYFYDRLGPPAQNLSSNSVVVDTLESCDMYKGYRVCYRNGSLDINYGDDDIGDNKIIVFVDGDVRINTAINLNDGIGFLMVIATGDMVIDPGIGNADPTDTSPNLEGIFVALDDFVSEADVSGSDLHLRIRGAVVGLNSDDDALDHQGVSLNRTLENNTEGPAEAVDSAPDQILRFPPFLGEKYVFWQEVAP